MSGENFPNVIALLKHGNLTLQITEAYERYCRHMCIYENVFISLIFLRTVSSAIIFCGFKNITEKIHYSFLLAKYFFYCVHTRAIETDDFCMVFNFNSS